MFCLLKEGEIFMSMIVKNNLSAQLVLGQLNKNQSKLEKELSKVSSGQKIIGAKDDASGYAISEKMREQIRSLEQDNQNVQNGSSLFKIADGAINNIVEELRNLKELAINAANDTNTSADRVTIQKEFQQKMANINDIATMTNYNGKILLDGRYGIREKLVVSSGLSSNPGVSGSKSYPTYPLPPEPASIYKNVSKPTGQATYIDNGINATTGMREITITGGGVFTLSQDNLDITIADNVTDVYFNQNSTNTINNIVINTSQNGNSNIWIDGLDIANDKFPTATSSFTDSTNEGLSFIRFKGSNNVLTVLSDTTLVNKNWYGKFAMIHAGDGLTVQGSGNSKLTMQVNNYFSASLIGSDSTLAVNLPEFTTTQCGNIGICNLNLDMKRKITTGSNNCWGTFIGSGQNGTAGDINVQNCTITIDTGNDSVGGNYRQTSGIGAGTYGTAGKVTVSNSTITAKVTDGAVIGSAFRGTTGDIFVYNSNIDASTTQNGNYGNAAIIGSGDAGKTGDITVALSKITSQSWNGAAIGCGAGRYYPANLSYTSSVGDIKVIQSTLDANINWSAGIGSGYNHSSAGDILVADSTIKVTGVDVGIGSGYDNSSCGDITVLGSHVTVNNQDSAGIGAGDSSTCGNILVSHSWIDGTTTYGAAIGAGTNHNGSVSTAGNITIINETKIDYTSTWGSAIGTGGSTGAISGIGSKVGDILMDESSLALFDGSKTYTEEPYEVYGIGQGRNGSVGNINFEVIEDGSISWESSTEIVTKEVTEFNPLKIHHGTKANQAINFYINDMHTKSLGTGKLLDDEGNFLLESDEDRYYALSYDKTKQAAWLDTVTAAQNKTLDDISVVTKDKANIAIRVLDGAIEYALDEATRIGSYLQRLEYTDANIVTMSENVQSAESTIRDADMAKEMTEYTKYNVLTQASQSMLAQANQSSSQVLSLLQ